MTRETVVLDTPAALATSIIETTQLMNNLYSIGCSLHPERNIFRDGDLRKHFDLNT
jgi:hypothetical protein